MTDKPEVKKTYCTHCQKEVDVTLSQAAPRSGQANLQESDEVVCLDFGDRCDGEVCPLSNFRPVVMGVRLARSGLREDWTTVRAQCEGCGQVSDLNVLDKEHAFCPLCGTTNTWMVLELDGDGKVAVAKKKEG
jgi:formate dehydrogenase maturation protein FdhE